MNVKTLRKKYPAFKYEKFDYEILNKNLVVKYYYSIDGGWKFTHKDIYKGVCWDDINKISVKTLDNLVFHTGLAWIPSYWKLTCSPMILVNAGCLNKDQLKWWKRLFIKGMAQYYFENNIQNLSDSNFLTIKSDIKKNISCYKAKVGGSRVLIPLGGGIDSAVTLEILRKENIENSVLIANPTTSASLTVAKISKVNHIYITERYIDPLMFSLNEKGYLNGHTPVSALLTFMALLTAAIKGIKRVVFSNERSSDEGNLIWDGNVINHQYSKTIDFEKDFISYNKNYLSNIDYYSFLRPLYELQVAKIFSNFNKYHLLIRSCNKGLANNVWCKSCPKCLSTFINLFPFIEENRLKEMIGRNLFESKELKDMLFNLIGVSGTKPFDCVGTYDETKVALYLSIKKLSGKNLPLLLQIIKPYVETPLIKEKSAKLLSSYGDKNFLDKDSSNILRKYL